MSLTNVTMHDDVKVLCLFLFLFKIWNREEEQKLKDVALLELAIAFYCMLLLLEYIFTSREEIKLNQ